MYALHSQEMDRACTLGLVTGMVRKIASFAELYQREIAETWAPGRDVLTGDWFKALNFFLCRVLLQVENGLSLTYYGTLDTALRNFFSGDLQSKTTMYEEAWHNQWIPHRDDWSICSEESNRLLDALREAKGLKKRHYEMVLDVLRFLRGIPELNLVKYSIACIKDGKITGHHRELQEIRRVGSRPASSYLGDLLILYGMTPTDTLSMATTQPMDRWVRSISCELGLIRLTDSDTSARAKILRECDKTRVPSSDYFAGARYLGTNSPQIARVLLEISK